MPPHQSNFHFHKMNLEQIINIQQLNGQNLAAMLFVVQDEASTVKGFNNFVEVIQAVSQFFKF